MPVPVWWYVPSSKPCEGYFYPKWSCFLKYALLRYTYTWFYCVLCCCGYLPILVKASSLVQVIVWLPQGYCKQAHKIKEKNTTHHQPYAYLVAKPIYSSSIAGKLEPFDLVWRGFNWTNITYIKSIHDSLNLVGYNLVICHLGNVSIKGRLCDTLLCCENLHVLVRSVSLAIVKLHVGLSATEFTQKEINKKNYLTTTNTTKR